MTSEANTVLNYLASIPHLAHKIVSRKLAKEILLGTDAQLLAQGKLWRIKASSAGAGLTELTCVRWNK